MAGPKLVTRLDALLAEKNLSGRRLARLADCTEMTVTKLRRNAMQYLDVNVTARICQALECTPAELLEIQQEDADT
ncbi:MAG: XRE family transcriptional regulator [Proteobacteria bacterium]|uniref:XRE family transcriptional regulator n=1 Tax=Candidatus Fonsibacter lacus TaxID=2576439 RepID=A0A964XRV4_9PROT|nr:XRE family transcriptional regulator [Candidatus Fonsibacter lacus]